MFTASTLTRPVHDVTIAGMSQARDAYHHGDLRNALVASAARLIEASGPGAFSLREAAREVGVSANAAYRHFDDKSALMSAVAADGHARLAARMRRAMDATTAGRRGARAVARFQAVGRAYVEFAIDHPSIFRVMFGEWGAACRSAEPAACGVETPWTLLGESLDALVDEGVLPAARRPGAELKAWTVVHGFASLTLDGLAAAPSRRERTAMLESLLDFAVLGLCGEVHGPRKRG
jgi:AcrR family transcriptional regulator